jgi:general secretion pathway protein E
MGDVRGYLELQREDTRSLVGALFRLAALGRISSAFFAPTEGSTSVRLGAPQGRSRHSLPRLLYPILLGKVKKMAMLEIAERRRPQRGRIRMAEAFGGVEASVATRPTANGEAVLLRFQPRL